MLYAQKSRLTILREPASPANDPQTVALGALGWILSEPDRAERLLALTGLNPEALRAGLRDRTVLCAVLDFLRAHEPDLVAAADALEITPSELAAARERLES